MYERKETKNINETRNEAVQTANVPEKKFRAGVVSATIWQNKGVGGDGKSITYRTVSFQRSYKDRNGTWQNANSLRINDLPKAALVLQKAYEYLVIRDQAVDYAELDEDIIEEVI